MLANNGIKFRHKDLLGGPTQKHLTLRMAQSGLRFSDDASFAAIFRLWNIHEHCRDPVIGAERKDVKISISNK